jgi:mycothiol synthase
MLWPRPQASDPPVVGFPDGYNLSTYKSGDEPRFYEVMDLSGWPRWKDETLEPWLMRIVPDGWFMIVHEGSQEIVATCMALHNYKWLHPFSGELGWLASDPAHAGKGLGQRVSAAVTARFIEAGYHHINLYTDDFRLPAIKSYLKLGYIPYLYTADMPERWKNICEQLQWPFDPDLWRLSLRDYET